MLPPDRIKPFLLHEDPYIRTAAIDYFADGWSCDPDLIPLVLDACERFGDKNNARGISSCHRFPLTESSLDRILRHLAKTDDPDSIYQLNRVIVHAPGDLLASRQSEVLGHPKLLQEIIPQITLRCDLAGWSGERIWDELQEYARRSEDKKDTGGIDHGYVGALVDALARHDVPDDDTVCRLLRSLEPEQGWLEIFLVDLAGERRIPQTALAVVGCPCFGHRNRSAMCMPSTPSAGIITASQTPMTIHNISR